MPEEFAERLVGQAVDGRLPPWPEWWGEEAMRLLLPDDLLRTQFVANCPSVKVGEIYEVMPDVAEPPASFIQLSTAYESETAAARERGWPTTVLDLHHLALLTDPEVIAAALLHE